MAIYKVPQDVEAEDKLLGPFSFRQFIYLGISGGSIAISFLIYNVAPALIILFLPIIALFGILALPLRKDQPMEMYLLAVARFYLKPKRRIWSPDGVTSYVIITAPPATDEVIGKGFDQASAEERLEYLSKIMDTRGWSVKGVGRTPGDHLTEAVIAEATNTSDIMDDHADLAKSFDALIAQKKQQNISSAVQAMRAGFTQPQMATVNDAGLVSSIPTLASTITSDGVVPRFNPYPTAMHQKVVQANGRNGVPARNNQTPLKTPAMTSTVSPDIIRLAGNPDLSISVIAREARRLKEGDEGEVVISLH
ncbi:MAG TPA: PrgI family protein [Patescibacteria group bacterium]|jgi:hypothetical protein|nr:PrgI family protein [Patescibacteria group bacterium]